MCENYGGSQCESVPYTDKYSHTGNYVFLWESINASREQRREDSVPEWIHALHTGTLQWVSAYIYIYIYIYTYIYIYIHTYIYVFINMYVCKCIYIYVYVCICIHMYIYIYVCICLYVYI